MPKPVSDRYIVPTALRYLTSRQLNQRPTTIWQLTKRMGLGGPNLLGRFEEAGVGYVLVPHLLDEKKPDKWRQSTVEILIQSMPESLAENIGVRLDDLEQSFNQTLKYSRELERREKIPVPEDSPGEEISAVEEMDPYAPYRINREEFETLRPQLITYVQLVSYARERGYKTSAIMRATGGDRMRYKLPSQHWRPYVYNRKKYYLRELLKHLSESDRTYKNPQTALLKRDQRIRAWKERIENA